MNLKRLLTFNSFSGFHARISARAAQGLAAFNSFSGFHDLQCALVLNLPWCVFQFLLRIPRDDISRADHDRKGQLSIPSPDSTPHRRAAPNQGCQLSIPSPDSTSPTARRRGKSRELSFNSFSGFHVIAILAPDARVDNSFNSFSGFHMSRSVFANKEFRKAFNSFSGFHLAREMWLAKLFDDYFGNFQFLLRIPHAGREGPKPAAAQLSIPSPDSTEALYHTTLALFNHIFRITSTIV